MMILAPMLIALVDKGLIPQYLLIRPHYICMNFETPFLVELVQNFLLNN